MPVFRTDTTHSSETIVLAAALVVSVVATVLVEYIY